MALSETASFTIAQVVLDNQRRVENITQLNSEIVKLRHDMGRVSMQVQVERVLANNMFFAHTRIVDGFCFLWLLRSTHSPCIGTCLRLFACSPRPN